MVCPKCNKNVNDELNYCPYCNHNFSYTSKTDTYLEIQKAKKAVDGVCKLITIYKKIVLIVIVTIIVIFILFDFITDLILKH